MNRNTRLLLTARDGRQFTVYQRVNGKVWAFDGKNTTEFRCWYTALTTLTGLCGAGVTFDAPSIHFRPVRRFEVYSLADDGSSVKLPNEDNEKDVYWLAAHAAKIGLNRMFRLFETKADGSVEFYTSLIAEDGRVTAHENVTVPVRFMGPGYIRG